MTGDWRVRWRYRGGTAVQQQRFKTERDARQRLGQLAGFPTEADLSQWDRSAKIWIIIAYPEEK